MAPMALNVTKKDVEDLKRVAAQLGTTPSKAALELLRKELQRMRRPSAAERAKAFQDELAGVPMGDAVSEIRRMREAH